MKEIEAIPTTYRGIQFKSRLEARWAVFLTIGNCTWEYEPNGPDTLPDFKIEHLYLEVKGVVPNTEYRQLLFSRGVPWVGIGGFFRGKEPTLIRISSKTGIFKPVPFFTLFEGGFEAFVAACKHRFDI